LGDLKSVFNELNKVRVYSRSPMDPIQKLRWFQRIFAFLLDYSPEVVKQLKALCIQNGYNQQQLEEFDKFLKETFPN